MTFRAAIALALLVAASFVSSASAEDFYKNKQLRLIAGFPALLARETILGPPVVQMKSMPGWSKR